MLIGIASYSQNQSDTQNSGESKEKVIITELTCEFGFEKAISDFENGDFYCFDFGNIYTHEKRWNSFFKNYIEEEYGIILKSRGCVILPSDQCYDKKMNELIFEKYGNDIFQRARKKAKELYNRI